MRDKPRPCKRCGRSPVVNKVGKIWYVECEECHDAVDGFWRKKDAIKAWDEENDDGERCNY